ncbi:Aminobenzoyl-glutamate transport protein [Serinicoccus hydrothermalis]|uniref:Aminobenzoyl-glutamate transport protein n=1 Tax=Serinicoccus hydrothermalis TaxID=1758689 RepID=A0A1B1NAN8_9MICO|nr:AbgT family transporter [Serinicoccus hydrothermalis]ANS78493.1 Aminobenzoyl-glutamate transport protein [Serinicoccus hydrothermalis]
MDTDEEARSTGSRQGGVLDVIERWGNRIPHPFWLFTGLAILVALLSAVLSQTPISVQVPGEDAPVAIENLLTVENLRRMVVESISNFTGFPPLGIVLVVMLGVAVAEGSGMIMAAVRLVVTSVSGRWLTFAIALTGITGSIASDAITVILPPLAAMAFLAVGRNPLVGIGLGFTAVSAGFNASLIINATDPLLAGISTTAAQLVEEDYVVSPLANIYFTVVSSVLLAVIITVVFERWISPRMEAEGWRSEDTRAGEDVEEDQARQEPDEDDQAADTEFESLEDAELDRTEKRALKVGGLAALAYLAVVAIITAIPGSPLRGEDGAVLTGPAILSVSILIAGLFVVAGVAYGRVAGTITSWADLPTFMAKGMSDLAPVLVLFFAAAQFIAWFGWSNMGTVLAVSGANAIESLGVPPLVVILLVVLMTYVLNLFITSGSAQWTLMAPVIVPALMLLGIAPEVAQMGFRIGDSASNIITPLNVYFALMLTYLQRYKKDAGVGTLMAMTLPASLAILVGWVAFFVLWYAVGLPLGPGSPVR